MDIWIFMDTDSEVGPESIKGIFNSEEKAKLAIAGYVLENEIYTADLYLFKKRIEI